MSDEVTRQIRQVLHDDPMLPSRVREAQEETYLAEQKAGLKDGWQHEFFPRVMTVDWSLVERIDDSVTWDRRDGLRVLASAALQNDGKRWLHVSCSRRNNVPNFKELREVKNIFIGKERTAMQVFPGETKYVNMHPYVLHMFCCLDGDVLPDFTKGTGSI